MNTDSYGLISLQYFSKVKGSCYTQIKRFDEATRWMVHPREQAVFLLVIWGYSTTSASRADYCSQSYFCITNKSPFFG
ncbi:MAG: hypothetical protein AAF806_20360, partial [Bacteroidota bacterium]